MSRRSPTWRGLAGALSGAVGITLALLPHLAVAACGISDPGACADAALYDFYLWLAGMGWSVDSTLLVLAYQLDSLRWWLTTAVFGSAFGVLTRLITPLLVPFATLAVIVGLLALLLTPVLGTGRIVNIRQALTWTVLAPLLLTLSGPLIVQLEEARSTMGAALFSGAAAIAPTSVFGAPGSDMPAPQKIYPANPCGGGGLPRYFPSDVPRTDELAATFLWARAEDIHCPDKNGPGRDIPDRFYEAEPQGPGYATDSDIGALDPAPRQEALVAIKRGVTRLFQGVLPSSLAVLDALANLIFALSLMVLWISLPVALLFVFWQDTAVGVTSLFRQCVSVLRVSWVSSFLLGLMSSCLLAAAQLKNGTAYAGFAIGGLLVVIYVLLAATDVFKDCLGAMHTAVRSVTGVSVDRPITATAGMVGAATALGGAALAGGVGAAVVGAAALQQSGSERVAVGAMLGRNRPIMQAGEIARVMGVGDSELLDGIRAGHASTRGLRQFGTALDTASRQTDAAGRTPRERAEERHLARQLAQASQPTLLQRDWNGIQELAQTTVAGVRTISSGEVDQAVAQQIGQLVTAVGTRLRQVRDSVETALDGMNPQAPDPRYRAYRRGADGRVHALDRVEGDALPEYAQTLPGNEAHPGQLLRQGYVVQRNPDQTVSYWSAGEAAAVPERAAIRPETPQRLNEPIATAVPAVQAPAAQPESATPQLETVQPPARATRQEYDDA